MSERGKNLRMCKDLGCFPVLQTLPRLRFNSGVERV